MNLLKDMELFVKVVHCQGLAAAGRELGLTAPCVTMRINKLEDFYQVKFLSRTTRSISLTMDGREFYKDSLTMIGHVADIENKLKSRQQKKGGSLRIATQPDLGRQHITPVINEFLKLYPDVTIFLEFTDSANNFTENNIDLSIVYGISSDSHLIARKIASSRRVLCASPEYLKQYGIPETISDLKNHLCLIRVRPGVDSPKWYFDMPHGEMEMNINATLSCSDGDQIRNWALEGQGIALKSFWDVAKDINAGRLVALLDEYKPDFQSKKDSIGNDLHIVYQDRKYMCKRTYDFMDHLSKYFDTLSEQSVLCKIN